MNYKKIPLETLDMMEKREIREYKYIRCLNCGMEFKSEQIGNFCLNCGKDEFEPIDEWNERS